MALWNALLKDETGSVSPHYAVRAAAIALALAALALGGCSAKMHVL